MGGVKQNCGGRCEQPKDLETRIADRLKTLSADDMQRLAEDYARICFRDRFPRFDFRALSAEGKTRAGWPDAYILLDDGSCDGVEATINKDKYKVIAHLEEDVIKAQERMPKLSGFVFISVHPDEQPGKDKINELKRRFVEEAGLPSERVNLVFADTLIPKLTQPEFARTRLEILGIRYLPEQFNLVRPRLPPGENRGAFIPTAEDYSTGRVHRPQAADLILHHLRTSGCALLRGVGASGKTVLAWMLALETAGTGHPAYYLDMARLAEDSGNCIQEDLMTFAHPEVLFVLDNIHLNEGAIQSDVVIQAAFLT